MKDMLVLFGGEYWNGDAVRVYNDLFLYNIKTNEWKQVSSPNTPPPRCSHQAVVVNRAGGQLWIFGGEFSSATQTQFYHHKDLWVLNLNNNSWEQIDAKAGPSPRSGHRMVQCKNKLVLFGGYFDQGRGLPKYNNETWLFDLDTNKWQKLEPKTGDLLPSARSGLQMFSWGDNVYVYGGYYREQAKKGLEVGHVLDDFWCLNIATLKWLKLKKSGFFPPQPRAGLAVTVAKAGAIFFGGLWDEEDTEDDLLSVFCNDMYLYKPEAKKWHRLFLRVPKEKKAEVAAPPAPGATEGNGTIQGEGASDTAEGADDDDELDAVPEGPPQPGPGARANALLAAKGNTLYLYGGFREEGEKEITLNDFYALDLNKRQQWETLIEPRAQHEWVTKQESDDEADETEGDEAKKKQKDGDEEDDSGSDCDEDESEEDSEEELAAAVKSKAKVSAKASAKPAPAAAKGTKPPAKAPAKAAKK
jgi:N-acetylneuraminic acid mutarotase